MRECGEVSETVSECGEVRMMKMTGDEVHGRGRPSGRRRERARKVWDVTVRPPPRTAPDVL